MKVVSISGDRIASARDPLPELIEELEALLCMAKAGEISGIAGAVCFADGASSIRFCGRVLGHNCIGALESVKWEILRMINEEK